MNLIRLESEKMKTSKSDRQSGTLVNGNSIMEGVSTKMVNSRKNTGGHQKSNRSLSPSTQQKQFQDNTPQEREVLSKLPQMEKMPSTMYRWNTNEEVATWLYSAQHHSEWCTLDVRIRPPNGSILLYHKKGSNYKHDGYVWKKRKDGKLPREDHMRLKVKGVEIIYANYVHSSLVPTFHRRSYWLLAYPDVVLVHYLNTPGEGELVDRILPTLRISMSQCNRTELLEQLKPMLCYGPLTTDDQNQFSSTSYDNESVYDERMAWVNALLDQAKQSKPAPAPASQSSTVVQPELRVISNPSANAVVSTAASTSSCTGPPPHTLIVTSFGQFLLAIDPQSPEGTALLAAQQQRQSRPEPSQTSSSPSACSESPPAPVTSTGFVAPAPETADQQQQQSSRALSGIRSNSCSSASRRVMCSTIMRRQPSAFSDGADDVFRPLTEAVTAASSSCSMVEVEAVPVAVAASSVMGLNDSAYCSFADAKDEGENNGKNVDQSRRSRHIEETSEEADHEKLLHPPSRSNTGSGDPMLSAFNDTADDSANLGLSQEDIATTLRANLAAMIDKPPSELFCALSPKRQQMRTTNGSDRSEVRNSGNDEPGGSGTVTENGSANSPMDEGCTTFIPTNHLLSSPDSSFRLLSQILSGDDYGDEDVDVHSMKSDEEKIEQGDNEDTGRLFGSSAEFVQPKETRQSGSCGSGSTGKSARMVDEARVNENAGSSTVSSSDTMTGSAMAAVTVDGGRIMRRSEHEQGGRNVVATIIDYSPDWSYTEGGAKILISGPWYSTTHRYSCLFGDISVPACLIQTGVLRCYCPPHEPATVGLVVCCDEQVISNSVLFEYRTDHNKNNALKSEGRRWSEIGPGFWLGANESHFCMGLVERLQALERHLVSSPSCSNSSGDKQCAMLDTGNQMGFNVSSVKINELEQRLVNVCRRMAEKQWLPRNHTNELDLNELSHHCGMTLIHFAAGLGFVRVIDAAYEWNRRNPSTILETELYLAQQDYNGRTPMMWACIRGKLEVATLLTRGCRDSLFIPDNVRLGELPLATAFRFGHVELVREVVQQFVSENGGDPNARDLDTALWVLTSGLVERSQLHYNKRPYIHARRHQMDHTKSRPDCNVGIGQNRSRQPDAASLRLRKQLSLDSQMIRFPAPVGQYVQAGGDGRRDGNKCGRECAKRASVEGLEELMRHAVDESCDHSSANTFRYNTPERGCIGNRAVSASDVGLPFSSKITRQESENSSSMASFVSVDDWLRPALSVEIPMEITVPDTPEPHEMWDTNCGQVNGKNEDTDGVRAQMASLAQQIIDALPDRIKQETFLEEDAEVNEQQGMDCTADMSHNADTAARMFHNADHASDEQYQRNDGGYWTGSTLDTNNLMSYRHYDIGTPCSSCVSPGSIRSPGLAQSTYTDAFMSTHEGSANDYTNVIGGPYRIPYVGSDQSQRSIPVSPSTFVTVSPASSTGMQQAFPFPPVYSVTSVDGVQQHQPGCSAVADQYQHQQPPLVQLGLEAKKLGEFFNATRSRSPLECHFQELTLTDREQRQLYEAAKVIQNAFRHYRQRVQTQTCSHMERQAAVVIQTCYRRYKQYCYFKKLHQAAVLIQKHFRLYKAAKRGKMDEDICMDQSDIDHCAGSSNNQASSADDEANLDGFTQFLENAVQQAVGNKDSTVLMTAQSTTPRNGKGYESKNTQGTCIRIQVTPDELMRWKQHLAAARIQHAFRGHRKRQDAAARKIQKFMREARQKLQKERVHILSTPCTGRDNIGNGFGTSRWAETLEAEKDEGIFQHGCQCMQMNSTKN